MSDTDRSELPSADALKSIIGTLSQNPELIKSIVSSMGTMSNPESTPVDKDVHTSPIPIEEENAEEKTSSLSPLDLSSLSPELIGKLPAVLSLFSEKKTTSKSKNEANREALLCALKPYLSREKADTIEKIIKLSKLGELLSSL